MKTSSKVVTTYQASKIIKDGGTVIFPTETVYGLGANSLSDEAIKKIFVAKKRPFDNPLIVHLPNKISISDYVCEITDIHHILMDSFSPGPISFVFRKNKRISDFVSSNLDTIAIRIPNNKIALEFLSYCNVPVSAPSANISTRPSSTNFSMAYSELIDRVDGIIDGDESEIGLESTVVSIDVKDKCVAILRLGYVTRQAIEQALKKENIHDWHIIVSNKINDKKNSKMMQTDISPVVSPGILYPHYKPDCEILYFDKNSFSKDNTKDSAFMLTLHDAQSVNYETNLSQNIVVFSNNSEYAKSLYKMFVYFEKAGCKRIFVSKPYDGQLDVAILEKIERAMEK